MSAVRPILDWRVRVETLGDREEKIRFVAPREVLSPLAKAIAVDSVLSCEAELHLVSKGNLVGVTGFVRARVIQTCSVSLEPFEALIDEPIDVRFVPEADIETVSATQSNADGEEGSLGMADAPEPIVGGVMDLGALVQEFLALGVDPYPRTPGVVFDESTPETDKISPFSALAGLKVAKTEKR